MSTPDIFVGIGGNLASPIFGPPRAVMRAVLLALPAAGVVVVRRSRWYGSAPVPASAQPPFVNGVLQVATVLGPPGLLTALHAVETQFGRARSVPNAARVLDLDLLAWGTSIVRDACGLQLPHPRMHLRAFVLKPLAELAPDWCHPITGLSTLQMLEALPSGQYAEPLDDVSSDPLHDSAPGA